MGLRASGGKDLVGLGYIGVIEGLYRHNGKEHGNYYLGLRLCLANLVSRT